MTALLVALGAAVGAPVRYLTEHLLRARLGDRFPYGTLLVNVAGSCVLGGLAGAAPSGGWRALLGTGGCGALTTFSTFSAETVHLLERRALARAAAYVLVSLLLGVGAAAVGLALTAP